MNYFNLNKILVISGIAALSFLIAFLFWWRWDGNVIGYKNGQQSGKQSVASLTGLVCENYSNRPVAVMMASDPIARPLSGISQADIVIEMPVTPNGITRMMAIFQCELFGNAQGEESFEIGSIRSAREDFLPLVASFGAIYAHWGGEREALSKLDSGVLDNIDALKYEGTVFYRKSSVPRPHNGFTTLKLITEKAKELEYSLSDSFSGYIREGSKIERNLNNLTGVVSINYPQPYNVNWSYDSTSDKYKRTRGGEPELDDNNGEQVRTDVVIVMHTTSKILNRDYVSVDVKSGGEAEFYQSGVRSGGYWENLGNNLKFYDNNRQEMKFVPGKIWIEIVTK